MITVTHKGNFNNAEKLFNRVLNKKYRNIIARYGEKGVAVLKAATPVKSGGVANAWNYIIEEKGSTITLAFINNKENNGMNIVLALVYGHGTGGGGYVEANNFVDPAIRPVFEEMAANLWKEVTA